MDVLVIKFPNSTKHLNKNNLIVFQQATRARLQGNYAECVGVIVIKKQLEQDFQEIMQNV